VSKERSKVNRKRGGERKRRARGLGDYNRATVDSNNLGYLNEIQSRVTFGKWGVKTYESTIMHKLERKKALHFKIQKEKLNGSWWWEKKKTLPLWKRLEGTGI